MIVRISSNTIDTNCYLIGEGGKSVIVDPACAERIAGELADRGWEPEYIFLTHEHFDHIWDLEEIRDRYRIPVVACSLCSERIQSVSTNLSNIRDVLVYFKTGEIPEEEGKRFTCREAEITFEDTYHMRWRGHAFAFQRLPGHSPGSVIISMDGEAIFTGDYLIFGEEEMTRLKGGSEEEYETIARPVLESIPEGRHIYPGHGRDYVK